MNLHPPIRFGLVGGGPGAFIGPVHVRAALLDGEFHLVCGAFSRDPVKSLQAGASHGLPPERCYGSYEAMVAAETRRPDGMQCVVIATPNHTHLAIATAALSAGLHVLSDKPATRSAAEALQLQDIVARSKALYGLTYTYSGYSLVREARAICRSGQLGTIRKVVVEYLQGWLSRALERDGNPQASWRTDPQLAGVGGCTGDIGVHAFHLLEFVSGQRVTRVCADVSSLVAGRELDDDCSVLVRLEGGAPGLIHASQVAAGERNGLRLRIYGDRGSLDWSQEEPDRLTLRWLDRPEQILRAGRDAPGTLAGTGGARLPMGHPEGFIEALANLYREFALAIRRHDAGESAPAGSDSVPTIEDGVRSLRFVEAVVANSRGTARWTDV